MKQSEISVKPPEPFQQVSRVATFLLFKMKPFVFVDVQNLKTKCFLDVGLDENAAYRFLELLKAT